MAGLSHFYDDVSTILSAIGRQLCPVRFWYIACQVLEVEPRSSDRHEDGQLQSIHIEGGSGPTTQSPMAGADETICELSR
jgi:hypothetical protein